MQIDLCSLFSRPMQIHSAAMRSLAPGRSPLRRTSGEAPSGQALGSLRTWARSRKQAVSHLAHAYSSSPKGSESPLQILKRLNAADLLRVRVLNGRVQALIGAFQALIEMTQILKLNRPLN